VRVPFVLPPGITSDDTSFLSEGRWEDGNNVRPWRGQMQTIGGWVAALDTALTGTCRNILPWTDNDSVLNLAFGTNSKLQVAVGGVLYDITPSGLAAGAVDSAPAAGWGSGTYGSGDYGAPGTNSLARTWSLSTYGETLIANPRGGGIYQWSNNTASLAVAVTNAPTAVNCALVTPERQILAFGCNEESGGAFNNLCIRGSDIEDITDWTTSSSNNVFEHILEGGGRIITARLFGSYVAVWTDNAVYLGQFLGNPGQAYRFDRVAENSGLIAPNAVVIIDQSAYWLGSDYQFRAWQLGGVPAIIACPIRNDFKDNVVTDHVDKIKAATITQYGEVWWHYPDARDGNENSRYVGVSTIGGEWFRGQMARTAFCDAGVAGWPLGVDTSGQVFYHENGQTANGGVLTYSLKSAARYVGEADQVFMVRGMWPDFEDQAGNVSLTAYTSFYPQADPVAHGPFALSEGQSKADFRATGRIASFRIDGASAPSFMRTGKPSLDAVVLGGR
jgi:hypothetical protein